MLDHPTQAFVRLFYSYSHKDTEHKLAMERCLAHLQRERLLQQWSDQQILPGRSITAEVRAKMDEAHIVVFLFSPDFIASAECWKEWERAADMASAGRPVFRVPIIVRQCAWQDVLATDDIKALPDDGKPVFSFADKDEAWQQVYIGIKSIVNQLRKNFTPKAEFWEEIEKTEFLSQGHITLREIFEFPRLVYEDPEDAGVIVRENAISTLEELTSNNRLIIHGHERCGKTALGRYILINLVQRNAPALLVDASRLGAGRIDDNRIRNWYQEQFQGDYNLWKKQANKTLIVDNLSSARRILDLIRMAKDRFEKV